MEYSENTKTIKLPKGTKLYHISKVADIKELIPQFRGKSERGYLYDKQRVYFTIRKEMPKFLADYKLTDKLHKYLCKKEITEVYVDPLVYSIIQGAVYVECTTPIPVEEVGLLKKKDSSGDEDENNTSVEETSFDIEEFVNFVTENGLIPIED